LSVIMLMLLPFFFARAAADTSMLEFQTALSNADTLNELCGLVIIQEFINIILAFSLLGGEAAKKPESVYQRIAHYLKFLAFMPSILLFYGVWYCQMFLYNKLVEYTFEQLAWATAAVLPVAALLIMETMRLIFRERSRRILAVMHWEYLLVVLAVFLPVAAEAKLVSAGENFDFLQPLLLLVLSALIARGWTLFFYILKKKGKLQFSGNSNP